MSWIVLELQEVVSHASVSEGNLQQVYILVNQLAQQLWQVVTQRNFVYMQLLPIETPNVIMNGQEEKTDVCDAHEMFADVWDIWMFAVILNLFLRTVCICRLQH